jgi:hypothetical protein
VRDFFFSTNEINMGFARDSFGRKMNESMAAAFS